MKRATDLLLTFIALFCLWPLLLFIGLLVRWKLGRPALFCQVRPGLGEKPFTLYKFRTMTDKRDVYGNLLPDGKRLTTLGRFLRESSLDELPELFNVLRGDMSLVGPRPLYTHYLGCYSHRERLRHEVRPGLTGWAQIHGRNCLPWDQRLALDVWYVENRSWMLDLKILLKTVAQVINRHGAAADSWEAETDLAAQRNGKPPK